MTEFSKSEIAWVLEDLGNPEPFELPDQSRWQRGSPDRPQRPSTLQGLVAASRVVPDLPAPSFLENRVSAMLT